MTTEGGQGEGNTLQGILGEDDEDEDEVLEEEMSLICFISSTGV